MGAHRSNGDRDVFRVGLAIARREDNARARHRRSACPVSSVCQRPRELTPTRERMGCREARHASVSSSRDGGVGVRRSSKDDRAAADRASITSTERSISWVSVSTVSVADAGRTHLRPCGSNRESGWDDVRTLKRGVEPERDRQDVRGLVARRHSNVSTHVGWILKDRDERVRRASIFVVSQPRSRAHGATRKCCTRAIRWKASRCEAVGSNPASGARIWCPRLAVHPQG